MEIYTAILAFLYMSFSDDEYNIFRHHGSSANSEKIFGTAMVFRHCVRSTELHLARSMHHRSFGSFVGRHSGKKNVFNMAFPSWSMGAWECLPRGLDLLKASGASLADSDDTRVSIEEGVVTVIPDLDANRDVDSARALIHGFQKRIKKMNKHQAHGLNFLVKSMDDYGAELFNPEGNICPTLSEKKISRRGVLTTRWKSIPIPEGHYNRLKKLQTLLGQPRPPNFGVHQLKDRISTMWPYIIGGSYAASSLTEAMLMQWGEHGEVARIAGGRIGGLNELMDLLRTHYYYRHITERSWLRKRDNANLVAHLITDLEKQEGKHSSKEPSVDTSLYMGHDGNLDGLAILMNLSWNPHPFPANATPPGSALRFDLLQIIGSKQLYIRASFLFSTFERASAVHNENMTNIKNSSSSKCGVPGCLMAVPALFEGRSDLMPWERFKKTLVNKIDYDCIEDDLVQ
eukprot:UC4_evm1s669